MKNKDYITTDEITYSMLAQKIDELQSNWNSLKEWLEKVKLDKRYVNIVLDKMNELEGKNKE